MPSTVHLPDDLFARLAALAHPFVDKEPADVIRRLLAEHDARSPKPVASTRAIETPVETSRPVSTRIPRERGARVEISGHVITADSVRDLYEQVLRYLAGNGTLERLKPLLPFKTSSKRYLIAQKPVHPNGKSFVVPVEHRGLFMEAHKSYQTALAQLGHFLSKCGHTLRYLG